MMPEISLNILDIAQNSVRAGATLIEIIVEANQLDNRLSIIIKDNGYGMNEEQLTNVADPFYTTRTTRKIGLGVPFFKMAALLTDGEFYIDSQVSKGTKVKAVFTLDHIDRMPLGDINSTIHSLIVYNTKLDFVYTYKFNDRSFELDTRKMRQILGNISFDRTEVSTYIDEYLKENKAEVDGYAIF